MPRHPRFSSSVSEMPGAIYSAIGRLLKDREGEVYPLHVGDTWMEPPAGCRMEDLRVADHPGMHRYASPRGIPELLEAVADRVSRHSGLGTGPEEVLVAAGATGALGAAVGAILEPGDEVLILAPHWPLISGIVRSFHGVPVAVPFIGVADSAESAVEVVARHLSRRTVALYINTPNNPTGRVLPSPWIAALAAWSARHDLWLLADEVYEHYLYEGAHVYARPLAPERTFSVHSFSKAYGMAGNRCGYVVGPSAALAEVRKVSTHTFYSTPTAAQIAALRALQGPGDEWAAQARERYRSLGRMAAERLGVAPPQGSTFLFLDVGERLDERGLRGFLEDCAERGLLVAPGPSFGPYPDHIRICFTSAPPAVIARGIEVLAELLQG